MWGSLGEGDSVEGDVEAVGEPEEKATGATEGGAQVAADHEVRAATLCGHTMCVSRGTREDRGMYGLSMSVENMNSIEGKVI